MRWFWLSLLAALTAIVAVRIYVSRKDCDPDSDKLTKRERWLCLDRAARLKDTLLDDESTVDRRELAAHVRHGHLYSGILDICLNKHASDIPGEAEADACWFNTKADSCYIGVARTLLEEYKRNWARYRPN
jgi:hypothetical protein